MLVYISQFVFNFTELLLCFFSFEQEENEMKMMNCICDEDEEEDQISSESTPDSSPSPIENGSKVKSSSRFLKSRPVKVQRSASSILRNKMYQVIKKKKKPKGTIAGIRNMP